MSSLTSRIPFPERSVLAGRSDGRTTGRRAFFQYRVAVPRSVTVTRVASVRYDSGPGPERKDSPHASPVDCRRRNPDGRSGREAPERRWHRGHVPARLHSGCVGCCASAAARCRAGDPGCGVRSRLRRAVDHTIGLGRNPRDRARRGVECGAGSTRLDGRRFPAEDEIPRARRDGTSGAETGWSSDPTRLGCEQRRCRRCRSERHG